MSARLDLLDEMGKRYLIEHVVDEFNASNKRDAFEYYISEMIRSMTNSLSNAFGGAVFKMSWREMLDYKPETRTAKDVKNHVLDKLKQIEESG